MHHQYTWSASKLLNSRQIRGIIFLKAVEFSWYLVYHHWWYNNFTMYQKNHTYITCKYRCRCISVDMLCQKQLCTHSLHITPAHAHLSIHTYTNMFTNRHICACTHTTHSPAYYKCTRTILEKEQHTITKQWPTCKKLLFNTIVINK